MPHGKYRNLAQKILANFITAAGGAETVLRKDGRYRMLNVPVGEIDSVMDRYQVPIHGDRHRGYYLLKDIMAGYEKLQQELEDADKTARY